jgi:hypothetical protein
MASTSAGRTQQGQTARTLSASCSTADDARSVHAVYAPSIE